jgi:hypothetical protein
MDLVPRWTSLLSGALLAVACLACDARQEVWFAPNVASPDMIELFSQPERWSRARDAVTVFTFYAGQTGALGPCRSCGRNTLSNLSGAQAFAHLRLWHVQAAIAVDVVKDWDCAARTTATPATLAVTNVSLRGGIVRYLDMDEPLRSGFDCLQGITETADATAAFVAEVQRVHPWVAVGDTEPYPHLRPATLESWLEALTLRATPPAFFHLDVDRARAKRLEVDVAADLQRLFAFCRSHAIPFGVIFWSDQGESDEAYYKDVIAWVDAVRAAIGTPDHLIFQSWVASPDGGLRVPVNLPDDDPAVFSHTRLVLESLDRFRGSQP